MTEERVTAPAGRMAPREPGDADAAPEPVGPTAAELEDRWRRTAADLENLRKRCAREIGRERMAEREVVATAFLPVLDSIDRALTHAGSDPRSIVEGVRALREQALAVMTGLGYSREDETGVPFDPARHEVVGVVEAGGEKARPGWVAEVVRPGYGSGERQLRPAAVTVVRAPGG
ncbi:nucleotide exchange factor GrpE [Pseudonocardia dioxanivorans]|nr:nucleotide exchange factor GrpE [Pseudonocardia dioxanivorans]